MTSGLEAEANVTREDDGSSPSGRTLLAFGRVVAAGFLRVSDAPSHAYTACARPGLTPQEGAGRARSVLTAAVDFGYRGKLMGAC